MRYSIVALAMVLGLAAAKPRAEPQDPYGGPGGYGPGGGSGGPYL